MLIEVERKASLVEHHAFEVFAKTIEVFKRREVFHREFLESCQDVYAKGE